MRNILAKQLLGSYLALQKRTIPRLRNSGAPWASLVAVQTSYSSIFPTFVSRGLSQLNAVESSSKTGAKRKRRIRQLRDPIKLTDRAAERIKELMNNKAGALGVRLGIKTRGCNGLSYTLNYATEIGKFEDRVDDKGVTVVIDPKALMHLVGTTMDFYEDELIAEFRFENPNADSYCGCGESFNPKQQTG